MISLILEAVVGERGGDRVERGGVDKGQGAACLGVNARELFVEPGLPREGDEEASAGGD